MIGEIRQQVVFVCNSRNVQICLSFLLAQFKYEQASVRFFHIGAWSVKSASGGDTAMAELWHYTKNGQPMDPVSTSELKKLAAAGELKPSDLVWKEGMANWVKAETAKGLFSNDPVPGSSASLAAKPVKPVAKADVVKEDEWDAGDEGRKSRAIEDDDEDEAPRERRKRPVARSIADDEWDSDDDRPRRRRRRDDDEDVDDDDRPRRRRRKKQTSGNGAVIGMVVGGVALVLILVGVVVAISLSGGVSMEGTRSWSLNTNQKETYHLRLLAGHRVELKVNSTGRSDVDLFVYDGNNEILKDEAGSSNCFLTFVPAATKSYKIEVVNRQLIGPGMDTMRNGHNSGTFVYKQINLANAGVNPNPNQNNNNPPPQNVQPPAINPNMKFGGGIVFSTNSILLRGSRKNFPVQLEANVLYTIDLNSRGFDTYLELQDPTGRTIAENDDIDENNLNSRIVFTPPQAGMYRVVVRSFQNDESGPFSLTVRH